MLSFLALIISILFLFFYSSSLEMNSTWLPTIFGLFWFLLPCTGCFVTVVLFMAICLPKCRSSLQDLTLTKRYIDSFEGCQAQSGERKMYTVSIFTLKGSICGPNHMWKPTRGYIKAAVGVALLSVTCRSSEPDVVFWLHPATQNKMCSHFKFPLLHLGFIENTSRYLDFRCF